MTSVSLLKGVTLKTVFHQGLTGYLYYDKFLVCNRMGLHAVQKSSVDNTAGQKLVILKLSHK